MRHRRIFADLQEAIAFHEAVANRVRQLLRKIARPAGLRLRGYIVGHPGFSWGTASAAPVSWGSASARRDVGVGCRGCGQVAPNLSARRRVLKVVGARSIA